MLTAAVVEVEVCILGRWHSRNKAIATINSTVHKASITSSAFLNTSLVPHFHFSPPL